MQWRAIEQKNSLGGHRRHHYRLGLQRFVRSKRRHAVGIAR
jgi:hypothetical protein